MPVITRVGQSTHVARVLNDSKAPKNLGLRNLSCQVVRPSVSSSFHHQNFLFCIHRSFVHTHLIEGLAVVDSDNGSDHFWDDDHVAQMCLDNCRLLQWWSFFLGLAQLLEKSHWLALQAAGETSADTAVHQLTQLLVGHVQKLIQVNSAVSEFTEGTLPAHLLLWCSLKREIER